MCPGSARSRVEPVGWMRCRRGDRALARAVESSADRDLAWMADGETILMSPARRFSPGRGAATRQWPQMRAKRTRATFFPMRPVLSADRFQRSGARCVDARNAASELSSSRTPRGDGFAVKMANPKAIAFAFGIVVVCSVAPGARQGTTSLRARELGISALIGGRPGPLDAITDVNGVEVGHTTLIEGEGRPRRGEGPGAYRCDGRPPARQGERRSGVRRVVHAERQRRDDRHDVARGERDPRRPGRHHQHP